MVDYILCSLRNVTRKRFRTALTVLSIAIGVASVVIISSIGSIGKQVISQELSSLGLDGLTIGKARKTALSPLRPQEVETLRRSGRVRKATGLNLDYTELRMRSLVANGVVWGVDETAADFISLTPANGRMLVARDVAASARVCVVDRSVAQAFYKRDNIVGKQITLTLGGAQHKFTVVGVVKSGGSLLQGLMASYVPSFVYIPYTTLQQLSLKADFDQIAVQLKEGQGDEAGERLVAVLEQANGIKNGYHAENITQQKDTLNRMLGVVTLVLSLIAGISLVVAGLGIMTVMLVSVNERTHEIGIKKAIGASRPFILLEFLIEALSITLLGSLLGAGAGAGLVAAGCLLLRQPVQVHAATLFTCILFSVLVGMVFGVYPASLAAKMKPVDALRSV